MSSDSDPTLDTTLLSFFNQLIPLLSSASPPPSPPYPPFSPFPSLLSLLDGVFLSCLLHWSSPSTVDISDLHSSPPLPSPLSPSHIEANLQSLIIILESFYDDVLHQQHDFLDLSLRRLTSTVPNDKSSALSILVEYSIYGIINGEKKEDIVNIIMTMTEEEQGFLMEIINTVNGKIENSGKSGRGDLGDSKIDIDLLNTPHRKSTKDGGTPSFSPITTSSSSPSTPPNISLNSSSTSSSSSSSSASLAKSTQQISELSQKISTLESTNQSLFSRINQLEKEKKDGQKRESEMKNEISRMADEREEAIKTAVKEANEQSETKYSEIRKTEITKLQREINEWESKFHDTKSETKRLTDMANNYQREKQSSSLVIEELKSQILSLKDDYQVASTKADQLMVMEDKVKRLQLRLEAAGDVRQQVEEAEAEVAKQVEKVIQLESQLKEIPNLKAQNQKYKDQVIQFQQTIVDLKMEMENKISEMNEMKGELSTYKQQSKSLQEEVKSLKNDMERNKLNGKGKGEGMGLDMDNSQSLSSLREANKRLEFQLKQLQSESANSPQNDSLQSELDIARTMAESSQQKLMESTRKVALLESQIRKLESDSGREQLQETIESQNETIKQLKLLTAGASTNGGTNTMGLSTANGALSASSEDPTSKAESLSIRNAKLEKFVKHQQKKCKLLEDAIEKLQGEYNEMKEEHGKFKEIIKEKEKEINEIQTLRLEDQAISNRERKLMSSAFYSLGMEFQIALMTGKAATRAGITQERLQQKSWINQQRLARTGGGVMGGESGGLNGISE